MAFKIKYECEKCFTIFVQEPTVCPVCKIADECDTLLKTIKKTEDLAKIRKLANQLPEGIQKMDIFRELKEKELFL